MRLRFPAIWLNLQLFALYRAGGEWQLACNYFGARSKVPT